LDRKLPLCGIHESKVHGVLARFDYVCGVKADDSRGTIIRGGQKIMKHEVSPTHLEIIRNIELKNQQLIFPENAVMWMSGLLGSGEEKAVYVVRDRQSKIFALELINEKHYLNGRLIDGEYFGAVQAKGIRGVRLNPESVIGLEFTGLVKIREFIYGYEWGGFNAYKNKFINSIVAKRLKTKLKEDFDRYYNNYKDVHDRNVMFELCPPSQKGVKVFMKDISGVRRRFSIRLRGIDLR